MQNSSMWPPLGLVIIGGMLISTIVTLFIVPILYLLLTPEVEDSKDLDLELNTGINELR